MPSFVSREDLDAAEDIVTIVNEGDLQFKERYNGRPHVIHGGHYLRVPQAKAWLWFGDPRLRTTVKEWNEEVKRVKTRHGYVDDTHKRDAEGRVMAELEHQATMWRYIEAGNIYVKEWGRGKSFYAAVVPPDKEAVMSKPLTPDFNEPNAGSLEDLSELPPLRSSNGLDDDDAIVIGESLPVAAGKGKRK